MRHVSVVQDHIEQSFSRRGRLNKQSQIKMVESVFVVIIFMIILVIGIVFFTRFQESGAAFRETERQIAESVQLAQTFAALPEISCSERGSPRDNCLDLTKLQAMDKLSRSDNLYYYDLFNYGTITIELLYPDSTDYGDRWTIYNNTREDSGFFSNAIPMVIYNPENDDEYFGLMVVAYYDD